MTQRFKSFLEDIVQDGDWEYANGDSMTEDAKRFLERYDELQEALLIVSDLQVLLDNVELYVHTDHPCAGLDVTFAKDEDDRKALLGQGYVPLHTALREQERIESIRTRVTESMRWEPEMLAANRAIVEMGTFGNPLIECEDWTYGRWQLEKARRAVLAVLGVIGGGKDD